MVCVGVCSLLTRHRHTHGKEVAKGGIFGVPSFTACPMRMITLCVCMCACFTRECLCFTRVCFCFTCLCVCVCAEVMNPDDSVRAGRGVVRECRQRKEGKEGPFFVGPPPEERILVDLTGDSMCVCALRM